LGAYRYIEGVGQFRCPYFIRRIFMNNEQLPWEKLEIKRILELFPGSRVFNIKKRQQTVNREVNKDEIPR
jgi:hypothetical protein